MVKVSCEIVLNVDSPSGYLLYLYESGVGRQDRKFYAPMADPLELNERTRSQLTELGATNFGKEACVFDTNSPDRIAEWLKRQSVPQLAISQMLGTYMTGALSRATSAVRGSRMAKLDAPTGIRHLALVVTVEFVGGVPQQLTAAGGRDSAFRFVTQPEIERGTAFDGTPIDPVARLLLA